MTKTALFLPTCRPGGIDVFEASIRRQTVQPDIIIIADEQNRPNMWSALKLTYKDIDWWFLSPSIDDGNIRHLAKAYNLAAEQALKLDADLFISLQDYIWVPEYGIERFVMIHEANPTALITGITHISDDPSADKVVSLTSPYSIFKDPFYDKPKTIGWHDVRLTQIYQLEENANLFPCAPEHWESNWSAVPVSAFEAGCRWDEDFDKGIAYENQDFAKSCQEKTGCEIFIDAANQAISLPHKKYFKGEEEEIVKYSNRWLMESKWA
jgi:hypothetical protein